MTTVDGFGVAPAGRPDVDSRDPTAEDDLDLTVTVDLGGRHHDLHIHLPNQAARPATGDELYRLLAERFGPVPLLTLQRTGRPLARSDRLDRLADGIGLLSGDRLLAIADRAAGPAMAGIELEPLTGPGRGSTVHLGAGSTSGPVTDLILGRDSHPAFDHPSVSRRHCRLSVTASGLSVEDLGATNPTVVNGRALTPGYPVDIMPGDVVDVGHVSWRLLALPEPEHRPAAGPWRYQGGRLLVGRAPRPQHRRPALEYRLADPPERPARRRFPLAAAIVPLMMGAIMAYAFSPYFAIFIAMSPLMVVWTFIDDTRSGRRLFERQAGEYRSNLEQQRLAIADAHDELAAWQRRRTPSVTMILRWVTTGARELWWRQPRHEDFLIVAVGTADRAGELVIHQPATGDPALVSAAAEVATDHRYDRDAPVAIDLDATTVVGITGDAGATAAVASALVAQLVGLRSHRDLQLAVVAPAHPAQWRWATWLPHVRPVGPAAVEAEPASTRLVAGDDEQARTLFRMLDDRLTDRIEAAAERLGSTRQLPHTVVVMQPPVGLAPAAVTRFLERAPGHGFSVIYLAQTTNDLPGEVGVHIAVSPLDPGPDPGARSGARGVDGTPEFVADVEIMDTGLTHRGVRAWTLDLVSASTLGRRLAPLVDVSAQPDNTELAATVTLPELLPVPGLIADPRRVAAAWTADPVGLQAVVGRGQAGPLVLDLKTDGPHGLVAGTTGSGKSEFLQTMLASLVLAYSPTDLNLILIDYKGGAAFRQCRTLPHTVGFVTDLDDRLAHRALISLRAELRRREGILARAGVSDLSDLIDRRHRSATGSVPASLLVVIDEFAALRAEVPEFVDGLVDVAQRGRSMGVHMILATQKPAGVITPQIEANTNIRVALRVATTGDSTDVIGTTAAADIPTRLPGRGLIKIGGAGNPTVFQSAYVGGRADEDGSRAAMVEVVYGMVDRPPPHPETGAGHRKPSGQRPPTGPATDPDPSTDLDQIVATVTRAWTDAVPAPVPSRLHRPWLPPLPTLVPIDGPVGLETRTTTTEPADPPPARSKPCVAIGLADRPERQSWQVHRLDLAGNTAVYGSSRSGKTTLLRTIAYQLTRDGLASASIGSSPPVVVFGVDVGGGLASLVELPVMADVVAVGDHERLQRLMAMLRTEVERRRSRLVAADAVPPPVPDAPPPHWLVLIDGFASFWATLDRFDFGRQADEFVRLLSEANGMGISFVVTADQRSAVPPGCLGAIGSRLVQRLASADEYRALDIRHPPAPERMPPGRTLVVAGTGSTVEVQVAVASPEPTSIPGTGPDPAPTEIELTAAAADGRAQVDAVRILARRAAAAGVKPVTTPVRSLPEVVPVDTVGQARNRAAVPLGLDTGLRPVALNLLDHPTLLVVGAGGSGKSTTLATILAQLEPIVVDFRIVAGKPSSPLAGHPRAVVRGRDSPAETLRTWADEIRRRASSGRQAPGGPVVIAIDDADVFFDDGAVSAPLDTLVLEGRDADTIMVMTAPAFRTGQAYETWIRAMRRAGHGVVLQPDGDREEDIFDVRFPRGSALSFPPGRGYHIERSVVVPVHIACEVGDLDEVVS